MKKEVGVRGVRERRGACAVLLLSAALLTGCAKLGEPELINVSYDPTREFYEEYNALFTEHWRQETGKHLEIIQSHGGSGAQALSVSQGLPADVVTLALEADVQAIAEEGLIDAGWIDEFPNDSAPYTSTIVFLVRKGNPKNVEDWDDLVRADVGVITPNPKTSGGARWNFLAAWAWAQQEYGGSEARVKEYIEALYQNVLVLDSGARGATTSFVENGQGDVLLTWENEGYLAMEEYPGEAQRLAAEYYYRPSNPEILAAYGDRFDLNVELVTIEDFGGWTEAQAKFFAEGGVFDMIYENMEPEEE